MTEWDRFYILRGKEVVAISSAREWGSWFATAERHVGDDEIGPLRVSTVFLGIDHNFWDDDGPPIVFETMIFGPPEDVEIFGRRRVMRPDLDMQRYATWDEAEAGHRVACEIARQMVAEAALLLEGPRLGDEEAAPHFRTDPPLDDAT